MSHKPLSTALWLVSRTSIKMHQSAVEKKKHPYPSIILHEITCKDSRLMFSIKARAGPQGSRNRPRCDEMSEIPLNGEAQGLWWLKGLKLACIAIEILFDAFEWKQEKCWWCSNKTGVRRSWNSRMITDKETMSCTLKLGSQDVPILYNIHVIERS